MLLDGLHSLAVSLFYALACLGLGSWIWQTISPTIQKYNSETPFFLISSLFLLGLALNNVILTAFGLLGHLSVGPLVTVLLMQLSGLWPLRPELKGTSSYLRLVVSRLRQDPYWILLIVLIAVTTALGFGISAWVRPPIGDAEAYYLVYPKIMAETGVIKPMPGPFREFSAIGFSGELHFAALMVLGGPASAKLLVWPVALTAGSLLSAIITHCGGYRMARLIGWCVILSSGTFYYYIYDGKVDLFSAVYGLAAIVWLLECKPGNKMLMHIAFSGFFSGMATVGKFSYIPTLGITLAVLLIWLHQRPALARLQSGWVPCVAAFMGRGSVMAAMALAAWTPHFIKNWVLFAAPLKPFINEDGRAALLNQTWFSPEVTFHILLTYPFALVFGRYPMMGGGLSFLMLAFLPLTFLLVRPKKYRESVLFAVTLSGVLAVATWMVLRPSVIAPRYILTSLLMLVPIVAIATGNILENTKKQRILKIGIGATCLAAMLAPYWHILPVTRAISASLRGNSATCQLASVYCEPLTKFSQSVRQGERIYIGSYYAYWLTPTQLQCRDTLKESQLFVQSDLPVEWLRDHGFGYIVIDPISHHQLADLLERDTSGSSHLELFSSSETLLIYKVEPKTDTAYRCLEQRSGLWTVERVDQ